MLDKCRETVVIDMNEKSYQMNDKNYRFYKNLGYWKIKCWTRYLKTKSSNVIITKKHFFCQKYW